MSHSTRPGQGITLVELLVSVSVLLLFLGMVAWLMKGATDYRVSSERKLTLLTQLQRNMFIIENDLLSARRHTIGNVLCNNIVDKIHFETPNLDYRMSSDPGFESVTPFTNDSTNRKAWYWARPPLPPVGIGLPTGYAEARVDQSPGGRLHGTGSLVVSTSLEEPSVFTVRSPDFTELISQDYVLAGWVRGIDAGGGNTLTPELAVQLDSGNGTVGTDIVAVPASALSGWTYVSVIVPWAHITPGSTYNVYLRTVRAGNSGGTLLAYFDDITMTPVRQIAKIDFESARSVPLIPDGNYNLHSQNNVGMVFHVSNTTAAGGMLEIKYVFSNGDLTTFPAENPDLLRFQCQLPYFRSDGSIWWIGYDPSGPPPFTQTAPLPNVGQLDVSWVGDGEGGSNRPILVVLTVRDRDNPTKTLALERTLFPPTD